MALKQAHVKNITANSSEIEDKFVELGFTTWNRIKETYTLQATEEQLKKLAEFKEQLDTKNEIILITKGGL